jgi:serpin B
MKRLKITNIAAVLLAFMLLAAPAGPAFAGNEPAVEAVNRLALDIFSKGQAGDRNILLSPYGIFTSMAMVYEGARGKTAEEMKEALHFPQDTGELKRILAGMREKLYNKERQFDFISSSALWASAGYRFLDGFLAGVKNDYYGGASNLDFGGDSESARAAINGWFETATGRRAKQPASEGLLGRRTKLVLTSAACLRTDWLNKFDIKKTKPEYFTGRDGKKSVVEMMHARMNAFFDEENWPSASVLELPFAGSGLSMLIFLPVNGDIDALEKSLTPENMESWRQALSQTKHRPEPVEVSLPKFTIDSSRLMGGSLSQLGMPSAFTGADLSGMTDGEEPLISQAIHQSYLDINEEGTQDAAMRASVFVSFRNMSISIGKPAEFSANHPFVFIIQENSTGMILFIGKVADPADIS